MNQNQEKTELVYRIKRFKSIKEARKQIEAFINFYNDRRPHMSIGWLQDTLRSPPSKRNTKKVLEKEALSGKKK